MMTDFEKIAVKKENAEKIKNASFDNDMLVDDLLSALLNSSNDDTEKIDQVIKAIAGKTSNDDPLSHLIKGYTTQKLIKMMSEDDNMNLDKILSMMLVSNMIENINKKKEDGNMDTSTLLFLMMLQQQQQQQQNQMMSILAALLGSKKDDDKNSILIQLLQQQQQQQQQNQQNQLLQILLPLLVKKDDDSIKTIMQLLSEKDKYNEKLLNMQNELLKTQLSEILKNQKNINEKELDDIRKQINELYQYLSNLTAVLENPIYKEKISENGYNTIMQMSQILKQTAEGLKNTRDAIEEMAEILGVKKSQIVKEDGKLDVSGIIEKIGRIVEKAIVAKSQAQAPRTVKEIPEEQVTSFRGQQELPKVEEIKPEAIQIQETETPQETTQETEVQETKEPETNVESPNVENITVEEPQEQYTPPKIDLSYIMNNTQSTENVENTENVESTQNIESVESTQETENTQNIDIDKILNEADLTVQESEIKLDSNESEKE